MLPNTPTSPWLESNNPSLHPTQGDSPALRDHERASYADSAAPTAALEWHRAFRDIEARLREWTCRLACGAKHEPSKPRHAGVADDDWSAWVAADVGARRGRAVSTALAESGG